ncbi:MAG: DNA-directed RNA polymerase subunit omega [Acidobacteriota bacterium]
MDLGVIHSKYRFIILAAKRARQLHAGAKPLVPSCGKKPVRIAQEEVAAGLVEYEVLDRGASLGERGKGARPMPAPKANPKKRTARIAS